MFPLKVFGKRRTEVTCEICPRCGNEKHQLRTCWSCGYAPRKENLRKGCRSVINNPSKVTTQSCSAADTIEGLTPEDEKMARYRAVILMKKQGLSQEDALRKAIEEQTNFRATLKTRKEIRLENSKHRNVPKKKKRKNTNPIYTVNGKIVTKVVSGGSPSLGKRK